MASTTTSTSTSPPSPSKQDATRQRIITHMNADHHASLRAFLQFYNRVPRPATTDTRLLTITPTHMELSCSFGRYAIPLNPPLSASLTDARERMVSMHNEAYLGIGRDPNVTISTYIFPPSALSWSMILLATWGFQMLIRSNSLYPGGSIFHDNVLAPYAPQSLINVLRTTQPLLSWGLVTAHVGEALYLWRSRLERYGVERGSGLWWKWFMTCLIGGFPTFATFDEMVRREREKKKH